MKVGYALLLDFQPISRESKDCGGMFIGVSICHQYYYNFYAMESTGLLNIDDPLQLFTLHLIFLPRINKALGEFLEGFNHHKVRTEKNWSPCQTWLNGMLHSDKWNFWRLSANE